MSFASSVKDDLIRVEVNKDCCKLAEFAAFLRISGKIHISGHDGVSIGLTTEHPAVARHIFSLIKEIFALNTEIIVHRKNRLKKNQVFDINIPHQEGINRLLSILGLMTEDKIWDMAFPGKLSNDLLQQSCCQRAYLRGAFLAGGSINDPSGEYHLEIACNDPDQAELLKNIMASFEIFAGITKRKQMSVIYLKESEAIVDTLNIMGSHRSLLEFENTRIVKEMRNMVNRQTNCENANLDKTVNAAMRQIEDIKFIEAKMGLSNLPPTLEEAAFCRLENPDSSLSELGAVLSIGRSGINHRLRRLGDIADELRGKPKL